MNRPTFIVIGAAKCGTTSICDLLGTHPNVFMTSPKEPHYYSRLTRYSDLTHWYESLFADAEGTVAAGEGSTSYTHPHRIDFVVPRLRDALPDAQFVYMVRHPVRRLESDWKMRRREERVSNSIAKAIDRNASLLTFGLYWKHLSAYRQAFSDDQLLVVFLEDFAANPYRELSRIFRHIGVDPTFKPESVNRKRNASDDFRDHSLLSSLLKRLPGSRRLRRLLPEPAVTATKSTLTSEFDPTPNWEQSALRFVEKFFQADVQNLLEYCEKPPDYWSFES